MFVIVVFIKTMLTQKKNPVKRMRYSIRYVSRSVASALPEVH